MKSYSTEPFVDDFVFLEGPRWHDGSLWVSDMMGHTVYRISEDGQREAMVNVPERPSGLGFLPDGTPLIVSMRDRRLYKLVDGSLEVHADAINSVAADLNDMVVDDQGRAYIGHFGYDIFGDGEPATAEIIMVSPDGSIQVVADNLECPNGTIISQDGRTLVVAESFAGRLTAFDRDTEGHLTNRRVYAELPERIPDGICLDNQGNIWVAEFVGQRFVQISPAGEIIGEVSVAPNAAIACQLGGADGRTLFCLVYAGDIPNIAAGVPGAQIDIARVDHGAGGSP